LVAAEISLLVLSDVVSMETGGSRKKTANSTRKK